MKSERGGRGVEEVRGGVGSVAEESGRSIIWGGGVVFVGELKYRGNSCTIKVHARGG